MRWGLLLLTIMLASVNAFVLTDVTISAQVIGTQVQEDWNVTIFNDGDEPEALELFDESMAIEPGASQQITFSLIQEKISVKGDESTFLTNLVLPLPTQALKYSLTLPERAVVIDYFPQTELDTDGKKTTILWTGEGEEHSFNIKYSLEGERLIPIVLGFDLANLLPGLLLAFFFGYFLGAGAGSVLLQRLKTVTHSLNDDEERIVKFLENGSKTQAEVQKNLGFSKAKLSRVIRSMEEREMIEKETKGRTNVLRLK